MLARIAYGLYWLGRDAARAEHTARMLDGVLGASLQGGGGVDPAVRLDWSALLLIMGTRPPEGPLHRNDVLRLLTVDEDEPGSVVACLARAREGARTLRDVISTEMWEALNTTWLALEGGQAQARLQRGPSALFREVRERSALFWGLTGRTMLRDEASAYLQAGGRLESADMVLRMLRVALPAGGSAPDLLQAVGAFQGYRRAVAAPPHAEKVGRFLLYERAYPDSVAASVASLHTALRVADARADDASAVLRLGRLTADLELRAMMGGAGEDLRLACVEVQEELARVHAELTDRYFAGATAPAGVLVS